MSPREEPIQIIEKSECALSQSDCSIRYSIQRVKFWKHKKFELVNIMSYNCEIENKLHQARLQTLNNHFEEAMQLYHMFFWLKCRFIEALDSLENHKKECTEEELEWTNACFNRTLEEFNLIRDAHPDIQIRVQDSDSEDSIATESIATESVADDTQVNIQDNGFLQSVENVSSDVINKVNFIFDTIIV